MNKAQTRGLAAAVLSPFFIALGVMVAKMAGHNCNQPLLITALSALMSVPFLLILQPLEHTRKDLTALLKEVRKPFAQVLITRSIIGSAMVVVGFTMTTALKSVLLLRVEALFVFAWSVFFKKEKASVSRVLLLLLLVLGSMLVVIPSSSPSSGLAESAAQVASNNLNFGDALIVCALLFISFSYIPTETVIAKVSPTSLNIAANAISGAFILLAVLIWRPDDVISLSSIALSYIFAYSVIFALVAVNLYYFAFKTIKPWIIASFLSLEVVYGVPLAWVMHGEILGFLQTVGAVTVMAATAGVGLINARESNRSTTS